MPITHRKYEKSDRDALKEASRRLVVDYGKEQVMEAISACKGRDVLLALDGKEIVGWQVLVPGTGEVELEIGDGFEEEDHVARAGMPSAPEQPGFPPVRVDLEVPEDDNVYETGAFAAPGAQAPVAPPMAPVQPHAAGKGKGGKGAGIAIALAAALVIAVAVFIALFVVPNMQKAMQMDNVVNSTTDDAVDYDSYTQIAPEAIAHIDVVAGDNISTVRNKMLAAGLVSQAKGFADEMRQAGGTENLKAANYIVTGAEDAHSIALRMTGGIRVPDGVIGINPGDDIYAIAETIDKAALSFSGADFLEQAHAIAIFKKEYPMLSEVPDDVPTLEGYFPEGEYNLGAAPNAAEATHIMLRAAQKHYEQSKLSSRDYFVTLTKASMIQNEALFKDDMPLIASVIDNRLAAGMRLQIDATVKYATGSRDARVFIKQTEVESPYNTYTVDGLPIGPICSGISMEAFEAALHPAQTDFLYYVLSDLEGHHAFSNNSEQFEADRRHYMEIYGITD